MYDCTIWILMKYLEKKIDGNHTRQLYAVLNKNWKQCPTKQQLYSHLPPISQTIWGRQTRHVGHCWRSKNELIRNIFQWTSQRHFSVDRPEKKIYYLFEDTGYCLNDLSRVMTDTDGQLESIKGIHVVGMTWWWWWWWWWWIQQWNNFGN